MGTRAGGVMRAAALVASAVMLTTIAAGARGAGGHTASVERTRAEVAALLDEGLRHMGGRARLAGVARVRMDMMTQWARTSFDDHPHPDRPSYEHHLDLRDYTIPAWRNTREFGFGPDARRIVNVIRDSIALTDLGAGFRPLSVAYVDERRELFAYTPDRLMLWARAAPDLRAGTDTTIDGVLHARAHATVNGIPMTLALRAVDGLPTSTRFRAGHPNDFGLVPWGVMDVEVWYSGWRGFGEVRIPTQWDVRRADAVYKRMTVLSADFAPDFAPDSFSVSDELRAAYLASDAVRAMHDLALDSARVVDGAFADFRTFGSPAGALRMGEGWLLLETGQAPLSAARAIDWLEASTGAPVLAAVAGAVTGNANGGLPEVLGRDIPTTLGPGLGPRAERILAGHGVRGARAAALDDAGWLRVGSDSVRVEPLALPDVRHAAVLWWPAQRWLWVPDAFTALDFELAMEHAAARGWAVERVGSARRLLQPVP